MSVTGGQKDGVAREMAIKRTVVPMLRSKEMMASGERVEGRCRADVDHDGCTRVFRQLIRLTRNGAHRAVK